MAATRLIALHQNKGRTVAQSLGDRTDYAKNPEKTEKGETITAYGCGPYTVDEEFMLQKRQYYQTTGKKQHSDVIAYQIRQSFKPQPYRFQLHIYRRVTEVQGFLVVRPRPAAPE